MWFWGRSGLSVDLARVEGTNWETGPSGERLLVVYFAQAPAGFPLPAAAADSFLAALATARRWVPPERADFDFPEIIQNELPEIPGKTRDTRPYTVGTYLKVIG